MRVKKDFIINIKAYLKIHFDVFHGSSDPEQRASNETEGQLALPTAYSKIIEYFSMGLLLASFAFVALNIITIYQTFFTIPHWDFWDWLKMYYHRGFWKTATAQYNEHRQFFPCFIFALDQIINSGRNYFLISALILTQIATFILLLVPAMKFLPKVIIIITLGFFLLCATWFQQGDNIFWPISFHTLFCNFSILLSLLFWSKLLDEFNLTGQLSYKRLTAVLCWAFIATFSFAHGIILWPFFIIISLVKLNWRATLSIIVGFICTLLLYFYDYKAPPSHSQPLESLAEPLTLLKYMAVYLSRLFLRSEPTLNELTQSDLTLCYIIASVALLAALVFALRYIFRKNNKSFEHFYCGVLFVVIGAAFITAMGRMSFGLLQATATRYVTIQLIFWNSLFLISLCSFFAYRKKASWADWLIIMLIFLVFILNYFPNHQQTRNYYAQRAAIQEQTMRAALIKIFDRDRWKSNVHPAFQQSKSLMLSLVEKELTVLSLYNSEIVGEKISDFKIEHDQCASTVLGKKFRLPLSSNTMVATGRLKFGFDKERAIILVVDHLSGTVVGWGNTGASYGLKRDGLKHRNEWVTYFKPISSGNLEYYLVLDRQQVCEINIRP